MMRYLSRARFNAIDLFVVVYAALLWKVDDSPLWAIAFLLVGVWLSALVEYLYWAPKK